MKTRFYCIAFLVLLALAAAILAGRIVRKTATERENTVAKILE